MSTWQEFWEYNLSDNVTVLVRKKKVIEFCFEGRRLLACDKKYEKKLEAILGKYMPFMIYCYLEKNEGSIEIRI